MNAKGIRVGDLMKRDIKTISKTTGLMAAVEMMLNLDISPSNEQERPAPVS